MLKHAAFASLVGLGLIPLVLEAADTKPLIEKLTQVGKEGANSSTAAAALRELVAQGPSVLLAILEAIDERKPVAANWLRSAADAIAIDAAPDSLPAKALEAFVNDRSKDGRARRLAYEYLLRADQQAPERLLPKMLDDPSAELRRDAIAAALAKVPAEGPERADTLKRLFDLSRDQDQVTAIAKSLEKLNISTDVTSHMGFVTRWRLVAGFENTNGKNFQTAYPPEAGVDLGAAYLGKDDRKLTWTGYTTTDKMGLVDLNKVIGVQKGSICYAYATVEVPADITAQIRVSSYNAVKIFLNGKELYARNEYHHGMRLDGHTGTGLFKAGKNEILLKICQNNQTEKWAQNWIFQCRVCDAIGGKIAMKVTTPEQGGK